MFYTNLPVWHNVQVIHSKTVHKTVFLVHQIAQHVSVLYHAQFVLLHFLFYITEDVSMLVLQVLLLRQMEITVRSRTTPIILTILIIQVILRQFHSKHSYFRVLLGISICILKKVQPISKSIILSKKYASF